MARRHDIYVSTGDWGEHWLRKGPSVVKEYIEECKRLGFDTIELDAGSLEIPEEALLRYVRMIKSGGLKVKPQFAVKFDKADLPVSEDRAFGAYIMPRPRSYDVDLLIRRAERCLEAAADMIMIDAEDICQHAESLRSDVIAKIIGRLGVEKTMFEASDAKTSEWFIRLCGPKVNLFVDHSQMMDLECLRGRSAEQSRRGRIIITFVTVGWCLCLPSQGLPITFDSGLHSWLRTGSSPSSVPRISSQRWLSVPKRTSGRHLMPASCDKGARPLTEGRMLRNIISMKHAGKIVILFVNNSSAT
ncbi:hypothetical protein Cgig2_031393 [Carnegiea gigantea]|uniref:Uncharacterized protein n=1 Tax=Carnegiea gigantea TaxID=171969 RepID=A0A9Q1QD83_9CARY|nr:hypothetical protein Cgig2_031393 [Carnegiea gigantea]